ncbi:DNA alkylation repair protein [Aquimarina sp. 2201CG14-23]|uniref:DNA alkylation repair protein n=1 Tax=Aquimarina mycalae TaxID=3040073 RepID=UPI0024782331|nr:DNA alkylation repair protein [Aquimarina sp. 2201CG14-23]MDH7444008.1 DNA alkylation repair protein [Aquimarina sp. 2201CG14-23]
MEFTDKLISKFENNANAENAAAMEAYLKNLFPLYGIKAPVRKQLLKETISVFKNDLSDNNIIPIANTLYNEPKRELHYCAIELTDKFLKKKYRIQDIDFIKNLIITNSWWDSVDFIAKHILGNYLLQFPSENEKVITALSASENMWLNRSAILFQLGYKNKTDAKQLFDICLTHKSSSEFFIQKAIGWALREYSKVNPDAVKTFVSQTDLKPLSRKEALKRLQ